MSSKYERRNARARSMGYANYWALRRALESGKVERKQDKIVARSNSKEPLYKRAGFDSPQDYMQNQREIKEWIKEHAQSPVTKNPIKGYEKDFSKAFVLKKNPDKMVDMRHYMVDVAGVMTGPQFDRKYLNK